ncbi:hypothetical protein DRN67_02370, partial [Candidatus Micrarchaeota archaeon]
NVLGCKCMVCNYNDATGIAKVWQWFTELFFGVEPETRLLGGNCKFVPCYTDRLVEAKQDADPSWTIPDNWAKAEELANVVVTDPSSKPPPNEDFIKYFMLGQGPTFSDFDYANSYCGHSMGLAVRWYQPTSELLFVPSRMRTACYLDNDIIPAYIFRPDPALASESWSCDMGTNKRDCFFEELVKAMGGYDPSSGDQDPVGPVIITPEAEFTSADVAKIANQINIIDAYCDTCQIVVIPDQTVIPDGEDIDENGVVTGTYPPDSALRTLKTQYPDEFDKIDMIGLHFFLNDYSATCMRDEALYRLTNYSKQTLAYYGKPSILLYYGAADYIGSSGGCTNEQIMAAHDYLITNIPTLAIAGIVGAAQYQFLDGGVNPLFSDSATCPPDQPYCDNLGLLDSAGAQKLPQFPIWFNRCQYYYNQTAVPADMGEGLYTQVPLSFPAQGENTSLCNFQTFIDLYQLAQTSSEPLTPTTHMIEQLGVIGCDACIGGEPPAIFYSGQSIPGFDPADCALYDLEAKRESEKCDLDPLMVKSVIWQESSFNPGAVSRISGASVPCATAYIDPSQEGCWTSTLNAENSGAETRLPGGGESYRPLSLWFPEQEQCACGLMQVIDDWGTLPACPNYNPFVPSSSICGGTYKMCDFQSLMYTWLWGSPSPHPEIRNAVEDSAGDISDPDDKLSRWSLAWLTLLSYNGGPGSILNYYDNWNFDGHDPYYGTQYERPRGCERCDDPFDCYHPDGYIVSYDEPFYPDDPCCKYENDFVQYVNECKDKVPCNPAVETCLESGGYYYKEAPMGNPYAAQVIAKYFRVLKTCPSNCEDGVVEISYPGDYEGGDGLPYSDTCHYLTPESNPYTNYPSLYMGLTPPLSGGTCTSLFCTDRGTYYHAGIDIGVPVGTPIYAAHDGTVEQLYQSGGAGNYIRLTGSEFKTYYMHIKCGGFVADHGSTVSAGDLIAYSGGADSCAGHSTGPHLHFEIRTLGNMRLDPAYFVDICPPIPESDYPIS